MSDGTGAERDQFYASFAMVHQGQIIHTQPIVLLQPALWLMNDSDLVYKCFLIPWLSLETEFRVPKLQQNLPWKALKRANEATLFWNARDFWMGNIIRSDKHK